MCDEIVSAVRRIRERTLRASIYILMRFIGISRRGTSERRRYVRSLELGESEPNYGFVAEVSNLRRNELTFLLLSPHL